MESDPATLALTGQLPFVVIAGAIIAYPLSRFLLSRYRAAVVRTMSASGGAKPSAKEVPEPAPGRGPASGLEVRSVPQVAASSSDDALFAELIRRPWTTVRAYALGGLVYAVVLATAQLIAGDMFSLLRFVAMTYIYLWPVVIAVNLIVPATRQLKMRSLGTYFAGFVIITVITLTPELVISWAIFSLPPTILVLAFLHRRVRAVGVMVLAFTIISLAGAAMALALFGASDSLLRGAASTAMAVGFGAVGAFIAIILLGAVIFAVVAWFANKWIKELYLNKQLSDQTLILDSMWLVFTLVQSIGLAFSGAAWFFAGIVAFVAYKFTVLGRLRAQASTDKISGAPLNLLFLRVFSLGQNSEPMYDAVSAHWRYLGDVRMIAGPDLAVTTVEPHEFLQYLSGRIAGSFIASDEALELRLRSLDSKPDGDGRYRVNDFFCYDDTWKMVLTRLAGESDAVLMDVRGFSADNAGVVFELNELINSVPIGQVVLIADATTNRAFLDDRLRTFWNGMRGDSPNFASDHAELTICDVAADQQMNVAHVLHSLCKATR